MLLWAHQPAILANGTSDLSPGGWTDHNGGCFVRNAAAPRAGAFYISTNSNLVNWFRCYPSPAIGAISPSGNVAIILHRYQVTSLSAIGGALTLYDSGGTAMLSVTTETTGTFSIRRGSTGGTVIGSSIAGAASISTWYWLGLYAQLSTTTGAAYLYVDNVLRVTASGVATSATALQWSGVLHGLGNNAAGVTAHTDFIYCDGRDGTLFGQAAAFNSLLSDRKVEWLPTVSGNGTYIDMTPSSGTNHGAMVDDGSGNDGDTTYVSSSTAGHRDSYILTDPPNLNVSVDAVLPTTFASKSDGGARQFKPLFVIGGTPYTGTAIEVPALGAYQARIEIITKNPATNAAWQPTAIRDMELGQELV